MWNKEDLQRELAIAEQVSYPFCFSAALRIQFFEFLHKLPCKHQRFTIVLFQERKLSIEEDQFLYLSLLKAG
jgi:hypothetical protein